MKHKARKLKSFSVFVVSSILLMAYQNCSGSAFTPNATLATVLSETGSGSVTVGSTGSNPPLDLFFIIDSSASMYENQVRLASSFNSIFQSNSSALANFNMNVYLFSTASTVVTGALSLVPERAPASITAVPAYSDINDLLGLPGSVYAYWNNSSGNYGTAPFSEQFGPAAVIAQDSYGQFNQPLFIASQSSQTAAQYQTALNNLSHDFQARLAYLNPGNQFQSSQSTDISNVTSGSSALCSMARIMKHSSNLIKAGDAAAFIIVSDDNDRLNDRNPASNGCIESIVASNELINGACGHYQTNYSYDTTATITYQTTTNFTYASGTSITYSYPSSASCQIQYDNGYNYAWTYTALNTDIIYTKCNLMSDGFCVTPAPNTKVTVPGNYVGAGGSCLSGASSLVSSPAPGTTYSCATNNQTNVQGNGGVDFNSNGTACSSQLLSQLASSTITNIQCSIAGVNKTINTVTGQALNSCPSYCASNESSYPGCKLLSSSVVDTKPTLAISGTLGLQWGSNCPAGSSSICGTGTISAYVMGLHPQATFVSASNILSTITVGAGATSDGTALTCGSSLSSLSVKNSNGSTVCGGASTVAACIDSLLSGSSPSCATSSSYSTGTASSTAVSVDCSTICSSSGGICTGSGTVAENLAAKGERCLSSVNAGPKSLSLTFTAATAPTASCSSLCSATTTGSCDGKGYGASDGSTVANYIRSLGGGATCTSSVAQIKGSSIVAQNSNPGASCTDPNNLVFFASGSAYPGTATTYTNGGSSAQQTPADFQNYILSQASSLFGTNLPAVAVIGHLSSDTSLSGTDPGTSYFNLASAMGSTQISSITATDYSPALTQISQFIAKKAQDSFVISMPPGAKIVSVSMAPQGSSKWTSLDSTAWSWAGQTLSISSSMGLAVGDQIMYQYGPQ